MISNYKKLLERIEYECDVDLNYAESADNAAEVIGYDFEYLTAQNDAQDRLIGFAREHGLEISWIQAGSFLSQIAKHEFTVSRGYVIGGDTSYYDSLSYRREPQETFHLADYAIQEVETEVSLSPLESLLARIAIKRSDLGVCLNEPNTYGGRHYAYAYTTSSVVNVATISIDQLREYLQEE